tara:strand:- start:75964 stop:76170 length:207 start_codon:yes stop_codon:yes gene_type:complete
MARNNMGEAQRIRQEKAIFDTARDLLISYTRSGKIAIPLHVDEIYESAEKLHKKFQDRMEASEDWKDD